MTLPLVQSRIAVRLPSSEDVLKCMGFIESESQEYARDRLIERFQAAGVSKEPTCRNMVANIDQFISVCQQRQQIDPWSGKLPDEATQFETYQDQLAEQSAAEIADAIEGDIKMDFAISNSSEFIRCYTVSGELVSDEMATELDKLFNAWLAENNIITKDSRLYQVTESGDISVARGRPVTVSGEAITQLINDKREKGLQSFLERKGKSLLDNGVQFSTEQHPFVAPTVQAEPRAEVKQQTESVSEGAAEPGTTGQRAPGG